MDSLKSVSGRSNGFTPIRCIIFAVAAAAVVFALLSVMSSCDSEADVAYSGTSGEVTWTFDPDTGKLEFSGSGEIPIAYRDCSYKHLVESVKTIVIGDSVTSVGEAAFQGCTGLTSVTIGNSVTSLGCFAFEKCKSLTSVFIPDSVTFIGYGIFKNCESLSTITVGSGNTSFCIIDGVLYNKDVTTLITCPPDKAGVTLKIPSTVTKLEPYSFSNCGSLKNLDIPDTVGDIGAWAFQYVYPDRITIPKYLDYINPHTFCNHEEPDDHYMDTREDPDFDGIRFIDIWGYLVDYNTRDGLMDLSRFRGYVFTKTSERVFHGKDTYTVTFTAYDGTFVKTARYIEGDTSVTEPANSSDYGYVYTWPKYTLGKENITVREERTPVEYTLSFDANGGTGTMDAVKTNVESFSEPENKFGIPEEHMHFDGWSLTSGGEKIDFDNFKLDNVTLYARWAWDQYKVTFIVDGRVYDSYSAKYGDIIDWPAPYIHTFSDSSGFHSVVIDFNWEVSDGDFVSDEYDVNFVPDNDITFTAVLTYNVKFISEGKIVSTYTADCGSGIVCPKNNPVKEADSKYTYTFASWKDYIEGMTVPKNEIVFVAQYTATPVEYTEKFISEGKTVKEYKAGYGTAISLPADPVKASDSKYNYTFDSWEGYAGGMTVPDHDIEFVAQFTSTPVKYNVKFTSDGNTVSEYTADYGSPITLPENPSKASDLRYNYTFALWGGYTEGMTVPDCDITFEARFDSEPIEYTVKFVSEGKDFCVYRLRYGDVINSPAENPVKQTDRTYIYNFLSWKGYGSGMTVSGSDITFEAQFESVLIEYDVKFTSEGNTVHSYKANYGSVITLPEVPVKEADSKYNYIFDKWEGYTADATVTGDTEFKAVFKEGAPVKHTVKFIIGETVIRNEADYGSVITLPESPSKTADSKYTYTFTSWKDYIEGMTVPDHDIELTAQFTSTPVKYNVKFTSDGNTVSEYTADYGSLITLPENPSKAPSSRYTYSFVSWKGYAEGMAVPDSDITFEARFAATVIPSYNPPVTPVEPQKETTTVIEETNIDDGSSKITVSSSESSVVTVVEKPKDGVVSAKSSAEVTTVIVSDGVVTEAVSKLTEVSGKYDAEEKAVVIESDENELTLSSSALAAVVDADASTEFRGETGTLKFSKEAAETLVSSGESITLSLSHADDSALTELQIGNARVFTLKASAGESAVSSFAGTVTVTLPYELPEGKTADDVFVYYLNDSGEFVSVASSYDVSSQTVTFETDHFSCWTVTDIKLQSAEESEEDQTVSPIPIAAIVTVVCIAAFMIICAKRN